MSFFNGILAGLSKLADDHLPIEIRETDEQRVKRQELVKKYAESQMGFLVGTIISVAFAILGICALAAGSTVFGTLVVIVAVPAFWLTYNGYKVNENNKTFFENWPTFLNQVIHRDPSHTMTNTEFKNYLTNGLVTDYRNHIKQGTILFEPILDQAIRQGFSKLAPSLAAAS